MPNAIEIIIRKSPQPKVVEAAFEFAKKSYQDKRTPWGETYLSHVTGTAANLDRLGLDTKTIVAGILHDIVGAGERETEEQLKEIKEVKANANTRKLEYMDLVAARECTDSQFLPREYASFSPEEIENKIEALKRFV